MAGKVAGVGSAHVRQQGLQHQLVVLPARGEPDQAVTCALDQARENRAVKVRDAAVLTLTVSDVKVTEPADDWPGRQRLGRQWWTALARALSDVGRPSHEGHRTACFRHLIEAGMSKSFLEEAAMALAASSTTIVMLADRMDVRSLLPRLEKGMFARVIYGSLPDAAVDELALAGQP
jgi:hypothetical protein